MKIIIALLILTSATSFAQLPKIFSDWEKEIIANFDIKNIANYQDLDFSEVISNQLRMDRNPWSTYIVSVRATTYWLCRRL